MTPVADSTAATIAGIERNEILARPSYPDCVVDATWGDYLPACIVSQ